MHHVVHWLTSRSPVMITFFQATCDVSDIDALFNLADSDGNGELSQEEFSAFIASLSGVYPGGGMTFSSDELISVYGAMNVRQIR